MYKRQFVDNAPSVKIDFLGLLGFWGSPGGGYGANPPDNNNGVGCPCGNGKTAMTYADANYGGDFNKCVASVATSYGGLVSGTIGGIITGGFAGGWPGALLTATGYGSFVCQSIVCK